MRNRRALAPFVASLLLAAPLALAADDPGLHVTVDVVLVDVVVVDEKGEPVMDLTKDDFVVTEEGEKQPLTDFDVVRRSGIAPGAATPAAPPAVPAAPSPGPAVPAPAPRAEGGTFLFFFDLLDTAPYDVERAKQAAAKLIETQLGKGDRAAALRYDGYLKLISEMTTDHAALAKAIAEKSGEGAWSRKATRSKGELKRWEAMKVVSEILAPMPGRKTLFLFSRSYGAGDGLEEAPQDEDETVAYDQASDYRSVLALLNAANVAVYPVDAAGKVAAGGGATERSGAGPRQPFSDNPREPGARRRSSLGERRAPRSRSALASGESALDRTAAASMFADDTGGEAIVYGEDLDAKLARIVRLAGNYYMLGYAPPAGKKGGFRDVKVEVKRPGLRVLARKGYIKGLVPPTPAPPGA